jgi:hypothetical protein
MSQLSFHTTNNTETPKLRLRLVQFQAALDELDEEHIEHMATLGAKPIIAQNSIKCAQPPIYTYPPKPPKVTTQPLSRIPDFILFQIPTNILFQNQSDWFLLVKLNGTRRLLGL